MSNPLNSLTDEQAIHAVKLFFDSSTPEQWEGGRKPTQERVKQLGEALAANPPAEVQSAVAGLVGGGEKAATPAQAQVSRLILIQLSQSAELMPAVEQAVEAACRPHKFIDPVTGGFILAFLLATTKIEPTPNGRKISFGGGMAELLHELPAVLKALPADILTALTGAHS